MTTLFFQGINPEGMGPSQLWIGRTNIYLIIPHFFMFDEILLFHNVKT